MVFDPRLESAAGNDPFTQRKGDDDDDSRDVRPGRGTEDRVVQRDPTPSPSRPDRDSGRPSRPSRPPREGVQTQPTPQQEAEQIDRSTDREVSAERSDMQQDMQRVQRGVEETGESRTLAEAAGVVSEQIEEVATTPRAISPTAVAVGAEPGLREATAVERGLTRGALELGNVFATAEGFRSGAEFAQERIEQAQEESIGAALGTTERAVSQRVEAFEQTAREQPVETAATLAGSLVVSGGVFAAARRAGPGVSGATRALIQPGEEIAGVGGFRATRAIAGERRAQQLFPQQEPLIFSEEAAIRAAQSASRRVQSTLDRADVRVRGVGAGIPALEVELEQEPTISRQELETPTLLRESARLQGELEQELLPRGEAELARARELELEQERFQGRLEIEPFAGLETAAAELAAEQRLGQELFAESELLRELEFEQEEEVIGQLEFEQEAELALELEQEAEQELEQEVEIMVPEIDALSAEDQAGIGFTGVRTIEAELQPTEFEAE